MVLTCPPKDALSQYLLGQVSKSDADSLDAHLEQCPGCLNHLDALVGEDTFVREVRLLGGTPQPRNALVEQLRRRLHALPLNSSPPTQVNGENTPGGNPADDDAAELTRLLAPAQGADELGRLGVYRVLGVLGAGGMGVVFLAEDTSLGRRVALKLMRPTLARDRTARERFQREARVMARLHHDHVAPVFQVGEERDVAFLAMPLLRGETLEARLQREGRLPVGEVVRIGREAALGLEAAHANGLVHRDVKPANLWLEAPTGRVKILDFGLARPVEGGQGSSASLLAGTPAYMPPEQFNGKPEPRSDLFALGCVLYRAATGKAPFEGEGLGDLVSRVMFHQPVTPRELNPELPAPVAGLIERLLAKDPAGRPASAREVAEALRVTRVAVPIESPAPVSWLRAWPAVALVLTLGMMVGAWGVTWLWRVPVGPAGSGKPPDASDVRTVSPKEPGQPQGPLPQVETTAPLTAGALVSRPAKVKEVEAWTVSSTEIVCWWGLPGVRDGRLIVQRVVWDLAGQKIAPAPFGYNFRTVSALSPDGKFAAEVKLGTIEIWTNPERPKRLTTLLGASEGPNLGPASWSPNGKQLTAAGAKGTVAVWDLRKLDNPITAECRLAATSPWSLDGKSLLVYLDNDALGLMDVATGKTRVLFKPPPPTYRTGPVGASWSPDGKRVAWGQVAEGAKGSVFIVNAETGAIQREFGGLVPGVGGVGVCVPSWSPDGKSVIFTVAENKVAVGDVETGKRRLTLEGHTAPVQHALAVPDGKTILSFGSDHTLRFWDATTGIQRGLVVFLDDDKQSRWLALTPEGDYQGPPDVEKHFVFRVKKTGAEFVEDLTPEEFARLTGWKNDPSKVKLLGDGK